jgi:hypothetical protein
MTRPLTLSQINQIRALTGCATGELFGKTTVRQRSGPDLIERRRYVFLIKCYRCDVQHTATWAAHGLTLLSRHFGHRTYLDCQEAPDPRRLRTRHAAAIALQRDLMFDALRHRGALTTAELAEVANVSKRTAVQRLNEMEADGEIVCNRRGKRGRGNNAVWKSGVTERSYK